MKQKKGREKAAYKPYKCMKVQYKIHIKNFERLNQEEEEREKSKSVSYINTQAGACTCFGAVIENVIASFYYKNKF